MPAKRFSSFSFLLVCGVKDNKKTRSHQRGCIVNCFIFPKEEMLSSSSVADIIFNAVDAPDNVTLEEVVVRRTKGDF